MACNDPQTLGRKGEEHGGEGREGGADGMGREHQEGEPREKGGMGEVE